jgi:fluoroacetyl-CoA thioesterase
MEIAKLVHTGMSREASFQVGEENTAIHVGSGHSKVLATPWMIAFMERTSHQLLAEVLPQGFSSVGVLVSVRHLAPTPVGSTIRVQTQVREIDGARVTFEVEAWDHVEKIGEGTHQRYVINEERFLQRAGGK